LVVEEEFIPIVPVEVIVPPVKGEDAVIDVTAA
jgi:hypothetical protein